MPRCGLGRFLVSEAESFKRMKNDYEQSIRRPARRRRHFGAALALVCLIGALAWQARQQPIEAAKPQATVFSVSGSVVVRSAAANPPFLPVTLLFSRVSGAGALPERVQISVGSGRVEWSQTGFESGAVYRVRPLSEGHQFCPPFHEFDGARSDLSFAATRGALFCQAGRITDPAGAGLPNATVRFSLFHSGLPSTAPPPPPPPARTDADGRWIQGDFLTISQCGKSLYTMQAGGPPELTFFPRSINFCGPTPGDFIAFVPSLVSAPAASFQGITLAPESIAAGFGQNLSAEIAAANMLPLPTTLGGTSVKIRDSNGTIRSAPLFFVSPRQTNFLIPATVPDGDALVTVFNGNGEASAGMIRIERTSPALFTANSTGEGVAAGVALRVRDGRQSFEPLARFDAAQQRFEPSPIELGPEGDQVFLILFGTGLRFRRDLSRAVVEIGGEQAPVSFIGAQGDFAGLDQVNMQLPRALSGRGEVEIILSIDNQTAFRKFANPVKARIR